MGMVHEILLRIRLVDTTERDKIEVKLNGNVLPQDTLRKVINMYAMDAPQYRVTGACWYIFRLRDEFRPVKGNNIIEVNTVLRISPNQEVKHKILAEITCTALVSIQNKISFLVLYPRVCLDGIKTLFGIGSFIVKQNYTVR